MPDAHDAIGYSNRGLNGYEKARILVTKLYNLLWKLLPLVAQYIHKWEPEKNAVESLLRYQNGEDIRQNVEKRTPVSWPNMKISATDIKH